MLPTFDLLQETVGKPLKKAMRDFGCTSLPTGLLNEEVARFLQDQMPHLPKQADELDRWLSERAEQATVIAAGYSPDGSSLFTIRFAEQKAACVVTLSYYQDRWQLYRFDSIETRLTRIRRTLLGAVAGSLITALLAGVLWQVKAANAIEQAEAQGYIVLTQEQLDQKLADAGQLNTALNKAADTNNDKTAAQSKGQKDETIRFTLQEGMTTQDLTSFLQREGLIRDQAAFNQELTKRGIDRTLRPKEYIFRKGMNETEILTILQG
jgi:hypothetical protein